jgi:ribonuclease BN (tRNA processing enzyme)
VRVHALAPTLQALRAHIFNGVIWPDFTRLPTVQQPVLEFVAIETGQVIEIGSRRIEVLPAAHTVPAVGYAVESTAPGSRGAWVFSGDTGPNPALWQRLRQMRLATLVIETAFGDDEAELAQISRHLCPSMLAQELRLLPAPTEVLITHIKPGEVDAVMSEIAAQNSQHRISALVSGQVIDLR